MRQQIRLDRLKQLAHEYRDFPIYSASQHVMHALPGGLAVLLLTHYYGIAVAGAYAFGSRILAAPLQSPLTALWQVLYQKVASTQQQGGSLIHLYVEVTAGLLAMALIPCIVLFLWAPDIFALVFGPEWRTAGQYAGFRAVELLFSHSNVPAYLFAKTIRMQPFILGYDLLLLALRASVLVVGGMYLDALETVLLLALTGTAMNATLIYCVGFALMRREGRSDWGRVLSSSLPSLRGEQRS